MRVFSILKGSYKGKTLHVTEYIRTESGVKIKVVHNVPTTKGRELQWVQTVTSNNADFNIACKKPTLVDPFGPADEEYHTVSLPAVPGTCKADDALPFYFTAAEIAAGYGDEFQDSPESSPAARGRVWTQFVLSLAEVEKTAVTNLIAIFWGFDVLASGEVRAAAIRRASTAEMKKHLKALADMYPDYSYS